MDNCLARRNYDQGTLFGRLVLFSIIACDALATLSHRLSIRQEEKGQIVAEAYNFIFPIYSGLYPPPCGIFQGLKIIPILVMLYIPGWGLL